MKRNDRQRGSKRAFPAVLAAASFAIAVPVAGTAAVGSLIPSVKTFGDGYVPFTPANIDPSLARKVALTLGLEGLRFTPAQRTTRPARVVTMAVRVDQATARSLAVRRTLADAGAGKQANALAAMPMIAPTRYSLGAARGFQSFGTAATQTKVLAMPPAIRDIAMADLSSFKSDTSRPGTPGRLQPRIAFEDREENGRALRTIQPGGVQTVDVGGAYRVGKNINVTAGVRVSQDKNRLGPLTDGVDDAKAVYVGTQFKF